MGSHPRALARLPAKLFAALDHIPDAKAILDRGSKLLPAGSISWELVAGIHRDHIAKEPKEKQQKKNKHKRKHDDDTRKEPKDPKDFDTPDAVLEEIVKQIVYKHAKEEAEKWAAAQREYEDKMDAAKTSSQCRAADGSAAGSISAQAIR